MFCENCGKELPENGICPVCNPALESVEPAPVEPAPVEPVAAEPVAAEPAPVEPTPVTPVVEPTPAPVVDPGQSLGLASLILGIVAIVTSTICSCLLACLGSIIPFGCGIAGIITGVIGMNKSKEVGLKNKKGQIGMILSIVALVLAVIFIILNGVIGGIMAANGYYDFMY